MAGLAGDGKLDLVEENHYYPFGLEMMGIGGIQSGMENPYKYNGKELTEDFGLQWYNYGFRHYDPQLGRWHAVDPLAASMASFSPFAYAFNNPVNLVDIGGLMPGIPVPEYTDNGGGSGGLTPGQALDQLWNSSHGGTWSAGDDNVTYFGSDYEALENGIDYNNQHNSWGHTEYGNEMVTRFVYEVQKQITKFSNGVQLKSTTNKLFGRHHYFDYNPNTGQFFIPYTDTEVDIKEYFASFLEDDSSSGGDADKTINKLAGATSLLADVVHNTFKSTKIGRDIAFYFSNSQGFISLVKYVKPVGYGASGLNVISDVYLTVNGKQSLGETGMNFGVSVIAAVAGGWPGIVIQANYQASKAYINAVNRHPDWVLPPEYRAFYH